VTDGKFVIGDEFYGELASKFERPTDNEDRSFLASFLRRTLGARDGGIGPRGSSTEDVVRSLL